MTRFFPYAYWAAAMIVLAVLARLGWADRDAVLTLLLVMPILAVITLQRGGRCASTPRDA